MQRAHRGAAGRVAVVVAVTLCAGLALTGCRNAPNMAAYVGTQQFTEKQIEQTVSSIDADLQKNGQSAGLPPKIFGDVREAVVRMTVFNEIARRYVAEKGYTVPAADYAAAAASTGLSVGDPYVTLAAESTVYMGLLLSKASPAKPSEADLRDAYQRFVNAAKDPRSFAELKPLMEQSQEIMVGVGLRNELAAAAKRYGVSVNPRYLPMETPTGYIQNPQTGEKIVLVVLRIGEPASDAVVTASPTASPTAS